ncbi:molybdate ABC transporter substrate-binding protein [Namhaeicola litoreus]|uniref:Molybdate ABC transporter substrate-binding protein n=1 Tax=Namhaeicola litoreus TaxID=1052145 RepID=A0ABW3Y232_9FLAO
MNGVKKYLAFVFFWSFLVLGCNSCGRDLKEEKRITIAAAANLQFVMPELTEAFTKKTGIDCTISVSSSGKLTAQISEGAPYDLFLSADMQYPNYLYSKGFGLKPPEIYAKGILVLWSITEENLSLERLKDAEIKHIAMANPELAPYGIPAKEILIKEGLWEVLQEKLVFGESISQTNQFIYTGVAEVGFTSKSSVLEKSLKGKGFWKEISSSEYQDIAQGILILKQSKNQDETKIFYDFVFSAEGREILKKYGYEV